MSLPKLQCCPVCGKIPKPVYDLDWEAAGQGTWITLQCHPISDMAHIRVIKIGMDFDFTTEAAYQDWNRKANIILNQKEK